MKNNQEIQDNKRYLNINQSYHGLIKAYNDPPMYYIPSFLTVEECNALINVGKELIHDDLISPLVGEGNGEIMTNYRSSKTCFISREDVPFLMNKVENILYNKPWLHSELPQISHYNHGAYYQAHYDAFETDTETGKRYAEMGGGQRMMTLLIYLNTLEEGEGGYTMFPQLNKNINNDNIDDNNNNNEEKKEILNEEDETIPPPPPPPPSSSSSFSPIGFRPEKGKAVIFFPSYYNDDNNKIEIDRQALHSAETIIQPNGGEGKWVCQIWIRENETSGTPTARITPINNI